MMQSTLMSRQARSRAVVAAVALGMFAGLLPAWAPTPLARAADPTTYLVSRNAAGASRKGR